MPPPGFIAQHPPPTAPGRHPPNKLEKPTHNNTRSGLNKPPEAGLDTRTHDGSARCVIDAPPLWRCTRTKGCCGACGSSAAPQCKNKRNLETTADEITHVYPPARDQDEPRPDARNGLRLDNWLAMRTGHRWPSQRADLLARGRCRRFHQRWCALWARTPPDHGHHPRPQPHHTEPSPPANGSAPWETRHAGDTPGGSMLKPHKCPGKSGCGTQSTKTRRFIVVRLVLDGRHHEACEPRHQ